MQETVFYHLFFLLPSAPLGRGFIVKMNGIREIGEYIRKHKEVSRKELNKVFGEQNLSTKLRSLRNSRLIDYNDKEVRWL